MKENKFKIKNLKISKKILLKTALTSCIYLVFVIAIVTLVYGRDTRYALLNVTVILLTAIYTAIDIMFRVKSKVQRIDEMAESIERTIAVSMKSLNAPVIYINKAGNFVWENSLSAGLDLKEYVQEITFEINKPANAKIPQISIENQLYRIYSTSMCIGDAIGNLVILVNFTKEQQLEKLLDNTQTVIGCITIDSFEEIMQGLEDIDKYNTMANIDKELIAWIGSYHGIVNKIEKDKYVYIIEKQYVKELENNSFEILKKMNDVSKNIVKIPITISIGISLDEDTLYGRYKSATTALDVAMGRGGNQAVVRNNKKYEIYGDNIEQDKTNRVRARTIATALKDVIQKCDHVYIMGHKNTDIDCIGAAVGIYKIATTYDKKSNIIVDVKHNSSSQVVIDRLKEESKYESLFINKEDSKKLEAINTENSLLVIVDTHKQSYLAVPDILDMFDKVVVIDHHRRGPEFIQDTVLTYLEVYASSTSELVTELLMCLEDVKLTAKEAESIYSGIVIDTKNFTFKTGVRTFEVAAYLKKMGVDMTEIKHMFQNDFETYMARVNVVKNAEIVDKQIAISCVTDVKENMAIVAAQAADELLSITGVLASFVLCEIEGVILISGRSLGDINVQLILEKLGGGGHITFAGAQLVGVSMDEARSKLLNVINDYFGSI